MRSLGFLAGLHGPMLVVCDPLSVKVMEVYGLQAIEDRKALVDGGGGGICVNVVMW